MSRINRKVTSGVNTMKIKHRLLTLLLAVFMAFSAAGCMATDVEELYSLPRQSEEYVQLQELIAQRIDEGGEYAAPLSGSYRQSVQLQDLDGDGSAEAIAFLADDSHTPTICIYRQDGNGVYYLYVIIRGEGSAVNSVEYADLNGDGVTEFIIAWQISGDIHLLSVYDLSGEEPVEIFSADSSEFLVSDLDNDGTEEILDLRIDYTGVSSLVMYEVDEDNEVTASRSNLSSGITEVLRARTGYLADETPALFVESLHGEASLITDVFIDGSGLENITMASSGASNTVRELPAYAADINADRAMEIPESSGDMLNWYVLDAAGRKTLAMTTYHDYEDGWYLILSDELVSGLTATERSNVSQEKAVVFSNRMGELFVIYTLTGENRLDRATADGRFILRREETTIYAAELLTGTLTEEEITENFNLIYSEWQTGDL